MTITAQSPAEFEEILLDKKKLETIFKEGEFGEFITNYVTAVRENDRSIGAQVKEQVETVLADMIQTDRKNVKRLNLNPVENATPPKYAALNNKHAVGAPLNGLFPDIGSMLQTIWHGRKVHTPENAERLATLNTYQEKVPGDGGFLVPEEFRSELLRLSLETSIVRPRARVVPMSSATLRFPAIDSTSNVSSVFGGIVVYRTEEGAELAESSGSFGAVKLECSKQTALAHVTNELINDTAGAFGMYMDQMFPEAIAFFEDIDFLTGTGVGEPAGAIATNNPALIAVAKESTQAVGSASILWENVLRMYARMLPTSLSRAVWVASPDAFFQLATMALNVGVGGSAVWLTDATGAPTLTLLGRPVIMSEKAPGVVGAQGDISFVDFGYYLIGDRQTMSIESSPHVKFTSDKTTFRVIQRNDGRPWLESKITPHNGSADLSPYVQVAVR
jgi:HK97 family phage major capsid protein